MRCDVDNHDESAQERMQKVQRDMLRKGSRYDCVHVLQTRSERRREERYDLDCHEYDNTQGKTRERKRDALMRCENVDCRRQN